MRSLQIFKIWGIPFKVHPYWFAILFLFSWSISNQVNLTSGEIYDIKESWLIGFFTSFFFKLHFWTYTCRNVRVFDTNEKNRKLIANAKFKQNLHLFNSLMHFLKKKAAECIKSQTYFGD